MAAGLGTRLKPLTDNTPKALVKINGIPLLEIIIKRLIYFKVKDIIVNVHHFGDQIIDFLKEKDNFGINIVISDERDMLLDTGGGLKKAAWFFNNRKPFLVYNVDIISNIDIGKLYKYHCKHKAIATLAVQNRKTYRYLLFDENSSLCGWKNLKTDETRIINNPFSKLNTFAFSGIQILSTTIFKKMNIEGKFSLTELYLNLASKNNIQYFNHNNTKWIDVGKIEYIPQAEKLVKDMMEKLN